MSVERLRCADSSPRTFPVRKSVAPSASPPDSPTNEAIRVGLARRRATQGALATHLQLSQPAIHRRMTGKVAWRISELVDVAAFLGLQVSELVAEETADASRASA